MNPRPATRPATAARSTTPRPPATRGRLVCGLALALLAVTATSSCSYIANEFVTLDAAGPVAEPPAPPSASEGRS